ncbi:phage tail protein [Pseudocitrobacter vendiensis]|uniref:Phage tail protein C-terminal domain-containing protein n=1 Tax=Pseudocitrobacter vendiensis TaxID=2488306 RepID=A0ABM9F5M9_9ENTR|nr:phage tail protein [Pseudocitrobacter vendiensis]CAH6636078.1 hypothetical protein FBBNIHIM_04525 [Pseudocitrobacter vendiensis]
MSAGTITLTNKSAVVSGNGTSFTTELAAGDFIVATVGGIAYTLPVLSITSATSLTLVSNFTGPTQSGNAWNAIPRVALNMVTAALVTQSAEALRGLNYDKQNWQSIFTGTGAITVTLPDGSVFSGPSWKYLSDNMATKSNGAVPIAQGGTGAKTAADVRTNLGLGSSATKDIGTNSGNVMEVGSFGLGPALDGSSLAVGLGGNDATGFGYWSSEAGGGVMPGTWQVGFNIKGGGVVGAQMILAAYSASPRAIIRCRASSTAWSSNAELYHSRNTTKASDGTLKAASPVIRIVKSQGENQRTDIDEEGFSWAGNGTANAEAEGVLITRQDVGVYAISGAVRLASSGWQLLAPMDPGGMGELGVVEAEQDSGGVITIKLYRLKYSINASGEIERGKGELIDVPVNSWIDVRLDMPTDSIWNQKQDEAINAMEEADAKGLDFTLPH